MASTASGVLTNGQGSATNGYKTPAQLLQEKHEAEETIASKQPVESHKPTVEDVEDEEDLAHPPPSMTASHHDDTTGGPSALSEKAAGKQKAQEPTKASKPLDTQSEEAFPTLGGGKARQAPPAWGTGAPTWGAKRNVPARSAPNGTTNGLSAAQPSSTISSRASTPASGMGTPASTNASRSGPPTMTMPGKFTDHIQLAPSQLARNKVAKPVLDDINRKSRARVTQRVGPNQSIVFEGSGPQDAVREALKRISKELGIPQTVKIPVPISVRPHIIGKGGETIRNIMQQTGARIQVPKSEETASLEEEDDSATVDVEVSGDPISTGEARKKIEDIVGSRTSNVNLRLKEIPPEFFPFIAGPNNSNLAALERDNLRIDVPQYYTWRHAPPPTVAKPNERPAFVPHPDMHIRLTGDRNAAQEARIAIERQVEELQRQLMLDQQNIQRAQHQFIIGDRGMTLDDFLQQTGCAIVLPPDSDNTEDITIIGPADQLDAGISKALELATEMQMSNIDFARYHGDAPAGAQAHARALTQYLLERQLAAELEQMHNASVVAPTGLEGPMDWQIFAREGKHGLQARNDLVKIIQAHPPTRFQQVTADPFFHPHVRAQYADSMLNDLGVRMLIPDEDSGDEILLIYEGVPEAGAVPQIARQRPSSPEVLAFQEALDKAQNLISSFILSDEQDLSSKNLNVPKKFHDKVRKHVRSLPQPTPPNSFPVNVSYGPRGAAAPSPENVTLRGPTARVDSMEEELRNLLVQLKKADHERGYTTNFDFPQKYANQLIGKKGENINRLRDEFDVDIQVDKNGQVEVKGPQAKAERCKSHIINFGKKLEDEVFYNIKVDPKYHRDLIGPKGASVRKLEDRYGVHVQFPTSKNVADDQSVADNASEAGGPKRGRNQPSDEIWIRGPRRGADDARADVLELVQFVKDQSHTATVSVAKKQLPSLMGKGGSAISALRFDTGAQIDVPSSQETAEADRVEIKIRGSKAQVEKAKAALEERAKAFDEVISRSIDVDKKFHQTLIGTGGSNIRRIVLEAGGPDNSARVVRFPDRNSESSTIRIEGPKALVDKVYNTISTFVKEKENQVSDSLEVPTEKHRTLIGRGGETRRNIESQFNVSLDIPKQGSGKTSVKVSGGSADVTKAIKHIEDLIKGPSGETVQVPKSLHHHIAQNGIFFRQLRNSHDVTVDHGNQKPPPKPKNAGRKGPSTNGAAPLITDDPSSTADHSWELVDQTPVVNGDSSGTIPWILSGSSPERVATAKAMIEKAVSEASKPSATGYLTLPDSKSYRLVVGPGGREINRIREKTGCKIQVPKAGSRDAEDAIEIVGSVEGVKDARDEILDIVRRGAQ